MNGDGDLVADVPGWDVDGIIDWCMREGRFIPEPTRFIEGLADKLTTAGAPLWRLRIAFRTLHPQIAAWGYVWRAGHDCQEIRIQHAMLQSDAFIGSPIQQVYDDGTEFRRDLTNLDPEKDKEVLFEIRDSGGTDYFALPLVFGDRQISVFILTTDAKNGFSEGDCQGFRKLAHYIAPVLEIDSRRRITRGLLDTYVGPRTGKRVLDGLIKRGDGEQIRAALWFSDLRNFTPLTESLPPAQMLGMLNEYFEFVSAAVTARGGEILRFIGDAMLIVFPFTRDDERESACRSALDAATDAINSIATVNHTRRRHGHPEIDFGVGLHEGTVVYGNVGAPDRLDFTVMGAAVNMTARLESLSKTLGGSIVMSSQFASALDTPVESRGYHAMKGISAEQEVFIPRD